MARLVVKTRWDRERQDGRLQVAYSANERFGADAGLVCDGGRRQYRRYRVFVPRPTLSLSSRGGVANDAFH
jgi:hypothetical protein